MTTLRGLFMRYYEVRESLGAPKTSMPQPESLKREVFVSNPQQARDSIEYQWAFLCDVELYLDRIDWHDKVIIEGRVRMRTVDHSRRGIRIRGICLSSSERL
jgi:hypothetical protein